MDWPVTSAYVNAFADAEGVKLRKSWRVNGFWGEVYRVGSSMPIRYEGINGYRQVPLTKKQMRSDELRRRIKYNIDVENAKKELE